MQLGDTKCFLGRPGPGKTATPNSNCAWTPSCLVLHKTQLTDSLRPSRLDWELKNGNCSAGRPGLCHVAQSRQLFLPCRALTKFILDDIRDFLRAKNPCVWWHVFLGLPAKRAHRPKEVVTRLRRARAVVRQSRQHSFWDAVHQLHPGRHPRVFRIKESSCLASSRSFLSLSLTFQNDVPKRIIAWSLE